MANIDFDILSMKIPQPEPECGSLLIAEPLLDDGCFSRSTVCIIDHTTENGSMGLVTNRLSNYMLQDVVDGIETNEEIPVYVGGPVHHDRLYYIHTFGDEIPESVEIVPGLYVGGDFERVKELIAMGAKVKGNMRFFIGYSGWESGQLRGELDRFEWAVGSVNIYDVLNLSENDAWREAVKQLADRYRVWLNLPKDVELN
ncbi:MAG: YqgE/AlgH family protein [Muribaculaceae bacterium]